MAFNWVTAASRAPYDLKPFNEARVGAVKKVSPSTPVGDSEGVSQDAVENQYQQQLRQFQPPPPRQKVANIEHVMSSPVLSLPCNSSMGKVLDFFRSKSVRHLVLVNDRGKMAGVLSERAMLRAAAERDSFVGSSFRELSARKIMTSRVLTVLVGTSIRDSSRVMFEERVGCLPVFDEQEKLVGIATRSDILRALVYSAPIDFWV